MKRVEMIKENFINMKTEYLVNHHKTCRKIDAIFVDETKHFKELLISFNDEHHCIKDSQIELIVNNIQNVFNSCKVILIDDYSSKFDKNIDGLINLMYDFFVRKLTNENVKTPTREVNRYLHRICKCDFFSVNDKLEDDITDFFNDFTYRYVNDEDACRDFEHLIKNLQHSLICELKKAISSSVDDKQDIIRRYNTLGKEILKVKNETR